MKKSTVVMIAIVYLASILMISIFGLRSDVYSENIPVTRVECINQSDSLTTIEKDENGDIEMIKIPFTKPGDEATLTGTKLQLAYRVYPDNASKKDVQYIYDRSNTNVKFVTNEKGRELGLIMFYGKAYINVQIMATDGTKKLCEFKIWVY